MDEYISTNTLFIVLIVLLLISSFFSASETAMMAINRYRLKHAAKTNPVARLIMTLLARSDRLLTVVLIGNSVANIVSASVVTIIGLRLYGELGALIGTMLLTIAVLLFAEIIPKIIASQKPEFVAYNAAIPLNIIIKVFFPFVWVANATSNAILYIFGARPNKKMLDILTIDEIRTVVTESSAQIATQHKSMLTSILDLEHTTVNDIMIPRSDIIGIDLDAEEAQILTVLRNSKHTLLPLYRADIDDIYGIIHMRDLSHYLTEHTFSKNILQSIAEQPYFIPEGTPLYKQLFNFQHTKNRLGLVVDEYGDIIGLVSLANIIEEIVGGFSSEISFGSRILPQQDNTYIVDGSTSIRAINQALGWDLPITSSKTLSGAIIEYLENIPPANTCVLLNQYPIEILLVQDNTIKSCRISPKLI